MKVELREGGAQHASRGLCGLAKKEVAAGRAKSLSSFVAEAVDEKLRRDELAQNPRRDGRRARQIRRRQRRSSAKRVLEAVVLDAGALIAFERGDARMRALVRDALKAGAPLVIPAGVLGQSLARSPRARRRSAPSSKGPTTVVPALDQVLAEAAGVLCGRAGTSDVIDASVVLVARARGPSS